MLKPTITVPQLPAQLYRASNYRVVHSVEEHAQCIAEGWSATPEPDTLHVPHTAVSILPGDPELALVSLPEEPAKADIVIAAGEFTSPAEQFVPISKSDFISPALQMKALSKSQRKRLAKQQAANTQVATEPANEPEPEAGAAKTEN